MLNFLPFTSSLFRHHVTKQYYLKQMTNKFLLEMAPWTITSLLYSKVMKRVSRFYIELKRTKSNFIIRFLCYLKVYSALCFNVRNVCCTLSLISCVISTTHFFLNKERPSRMKSFKSRTTDFRKTDFKTTEEEPGIVHSVHCACKHSCIPTYAHNRVKNH